MTDSIPALLLEIDRARNAFNLESSTFLAERLVQLSPTEEHLNILAESYLHSRNFSQVCQLLKNRPGKRSRYLLAQAYFKLDNLKEAEQALTSSRTFGVEDFLGQAGDPKDRAPHFGQLGKDFLGLSMGFSGGLLSHKPMANYTEGFHPGKDDPIGQGGPFFVSQKKTGTTQYLLNLTKKGFNTFTDFLGKKPKRRPDEPKPRAGDAKAQSPNEPNSLGVAGKETANPKSL